MIDSPEADQFLKNKLKVNIDDPTNQPCKGCFEGTTNIQIKNRIEKSAEDILFDKIPKMNIINMSYQDHAYFLNLAYNNLRIFKSVMIKGNSKALESFERLANKDDRLLIESTTEGLFIQYNS